MSLAPPVSASTAFLNVPPAEAERRQQAAIQLLTEKGIDQATVVSPVKIEDDSHDDNDDKRDFNDEEADFYEEDSFDYLDDFYEASLPRLGLINGRYELSNESNLHFPSSFLILTLCGTKLWGRFFINGVVEGVLWMSERPFHASLSNLPFLWRGVDVSSSSQEDKICHGNGRLRFLGGGRVDGSLDHLKQESFEANRLPNQGTRSECMLELCWGFGRSMLKQGGRRIGGRGGGLRRNGFWLSQWLLDK
ncbi:hypothetical protein F4782DRAFT_551699 [Xylaria castorea]|nr:hypothetical protein F4782DRAFT_551699 [Xylaria castorea]